MQKLDEATVLYIRMFREVSMPLFEAMIAQLCASSTLPHELATVLEDIGHRFIFLGEVVNQELLRRGVLDDEADADSTVEATIDGVILQLLSHLLKIKTPEGKRANAMLSTPAGRQALKTAFALACPLPVARPFAKSH